MRYATLNQSDFSISVSLIGYYIAMVSHVTVSAFRLAPYINRFIVIFKHNDRRPRVLATIDGLVLH